MLKTELMQTGVLPSPLLFNTTQLAGIYLHIPFCRQACTYCNFHFTTSLRYKDELVRALIKEAEAEKEFLKGETVETVYFGGGTPSLLPEQDIENILKSLQSNFPISRNAEITLEANPDDMSREKLSAWKEMGINRLSTGVQSFFEEELRWMNRAHHAGQAIEAMEAALQFFTNISMDLIYGSPLLTDEMWKSNVDRATEMGIPHLSCYALTVEEKTPLHKMVVAKSSADVDGERQARQFLLLMQWLREKGYEHYEVSNFAKPGFRSRHNSAYWKGIPYLGLGPAAHSFNGQIRRWNLPNNNRYIGSVTNGIAERETEILTPAQKMNEYLMISLRTKEGIDLDFIEKQWDEAQRKRVEEIFQKYKEGFLLKHSGTRVQLTDEGMLRADGIAAELFM
jgi:oxygen-independent coproporphyrinogen-3 oxidase